MGKRSPHQSYMTKTSIPKSPVQKSPMVKTSVSRSSLSLPRSPVSKIPMPKSPMPRSPMPNSPIPKSPVVYEKYKSRCAYGLISIFNFRRRNSKKLISDTDRRRLSRHAHAVGDGYIQNRLDLHPDQHIDEEVHDQTAVADSADLQANKVKGENGSIEEKTRKKIATSRVGNVQSNSEVVHGLSRNQRKATKTASRARRLPIYGCYDVSTVRNADPTRESLADRSSKSIDSAVTAEKLPNQVSLENGDRNCSDTDCVQYDGLTEINLQVNMSEATEAFINQKLIDGKQLCGDGVSHQSKHFLDALKILNSNKDLFVKLLQDPNSLLVKHIEDLRDCQANEQQTRPLIKAVPEHEIGNASDCNLSKSKDTGDHQPLENIVVLRPNRSSQDSLHINYGLRNVQQSVRPAFFPFEKMKRKLMQTMGIHRKEKQFMLTEEAAHHRSTHDSKGIEGCGERAVPDRPTSHFGGTTLSSIGIKKEDKMDKVNEFDPGITEEAAESCCENSCSTTSRSPKRNKLVADVEPRINIFEDGNSNLLRKQRAKTWDGISLFPECDFLPVVSPRGTTEHASVSPQMRFSAYSNHQVGNDNYWKSQKEKKKSCLSPQRQNLEAPPWVVNKKQLHMHEKVSDNLFPDVLEHKSISSLNNDLDQLETKCIENSEESSSSEVPSKPESSHSDEVKQSTEAVDTCEEDGSMDFSRMDSPVENQTSTTTSVDDYSTSPLNSRNIGEFDRIKDNSEQPSPVSVLDQFFTEDVKGRLSSESQPALPSIRRLQIGSEEGCIPASQSPLEVNLNLSTSTEEYGSMFKYVSTVLEACGLNWDELTLKRHFSDQLLDGSLLDSIEVWPKSCGDRSLLFDYINEVVADICQCYPRCSPWLSFIKPRTLSTMITGSVLHEVMKNVDWSLLSASPLQTLEKIAEKDMHRSGTWINIRIDAEDVVSELVDNLVEELTTEVAFE